MFFFKGTVFAASTSAFTSLFADSSNGRREGFVGKTPGTVPATVVPRSLCQERRRDMPEVLPKGFLRDRRVRVQWHVYENSQRSPLSNNGTCGTAQSTSSSHRSHYRHVIHCVRVQHILYGTFSPVVLPWARLQSTSFQRKQIFALQYGSYIRGALEYED